MIRPLRLLGEYFLGTETSRWYSNQRIVAREHLPEKDDPDLNTSKLKKYLQSSYFEQTLHLGIGRVVPDVSLIACLYNVSNPKIGYLVTVGEAVRVVEMLLHRFFRKPFIQSEYVNGEEKEEWKPEDADGWKVNKPKNWEDDGEEWKE